ncbi:MAG: amidohydrolase family protein [Treponema sp.]|nr:amidohydrolase family protein [Treponema sp.]
MERYVIKGDVVYTKSCDSFVQEPDSYVLCENGQCKGVCHHLPDAWKTAQLYDYSGLLVIPGFVDLHAHAPQYGYRGMGMDLQLLEWLNTYTFPEESKYADSAYAAKMYGSFTAELLRGPTTRAVLFGTIHTDADLLLADLLEKTGLQILLGKVNMDRNSPEYLCETTEQSITETLRYIEGMHCFQNVKAIITPRFVPSCTADLLKELGSIAKNYNLPVQSHLDENVSEIAWVKELHPECSSYTDVYHRYNLLNEKTVMAHCVHPDKTEQEQLRQSGTFIAHCPQSNVNLCSGVAPVVHYLETHQHVGLGSDVAGGSSLNMFRAASDAIQASKLRYYFTKEDRPLKVSEAFYLATKGGGVYFGKVGSFEDGYALDALIIDDTGFSPLPNVSLERRAERVLYVSEYSSIRAKFVNGRRVYEKS